MTYTETPVLIVGGGPVGLALAVQLDRFGIDTHLYLPHVGFNRKVGIFAGHHVTPHGELISEELWEQNRDEWLPSAADKEHVRSLMRPVYEPGKIAAWVAPPSQGINGKPFEYEYVHF